ncbi:hemolysin family protein [Nocardioides jiangxiensis]|uniref:Hemolysin family protein n=1 Tax=Nocardioides jiangxiensis TaxID=3064524 RepID=A0ABT9AXB9_9ACTN|nr:hemolysin family protein [Nocardioides sp. WY-20]MDO7867177.1 hemolysin family protein [Nocardioides sp. WY-20]
MEPADLWLLVLAVALTAVAGLLSAVDAALISFSRARAEEIEHERRTGAGKLVRLLEDPPRYLNSVLLLRIAAEVAATVMVAHLALDHLDVWWQATLLATAAMVVVSYVVVGVAPRTLGRQHAEPIALAAAPVLLALTPLLGPLPRLLILLGNAITPGKGFREGPFASETELRELVDLASASSVIEEGERQMVHNVFELGDTTVREVMVPRNDVVFVERHKNLRQTMSLFLRSGYSRLPVIGDNLDDVVGLAYLKDVSRRVFEDADAETTQRIDTLLRPAHWVPDSLPADALLKEMQARRQHMAIVVDEYGGTAGIVTIEDVLEEIVGEITDEYDAAEVEVEHLDEGRVKVSSRFPVDDLDELFPDIALSDDDVDSVGGLMAKFMGVVPIPGSVVEVEAEGGRLHFEAVAASGRRNRVDTVVITRLAAPEGAPDAADESGSVA